MLYDATVLIVVYTYVYIYAWMGETDTRGRESINMSCSKAPIHQITSQTHLLDACPCTYVPVMLFAHADPFEVDDVGVREGFQNVDFTH